MKPRRVIVTLEMTTDETLQALRGKEFWEVALPGYGLGSREYLKIHQVQANVVQDWAKKKAKK